MPFKPVIRECVVEDEGEEYKFWVREPSGREILIEGQKRSKMKEGQAIDNTRDLFKKFIVHDDSTEISNEEVEAILDMRLSAMNKVLNKVNEMIGIKTVVGEGKNS